MCDELNLACETVKCGYAAGTLFHKFTGKGPCSLDNTRELLRVGDIKVPKSGVVVVGVNLTGSDSRLNHQMAFVVTPSGLVHTVQAYFPHIRKAQTWSMSFSSFKAAIQRMAETGVVLDRDAFDILTRMSHAQRDMSAGAEGFLFSKDRIAGTEHIGKVFLSSLRCTTRLTGLVVAAR